MPVKVDNSYAFFMIPALRFENVMCLLDLSFINSILIFLRPDFLSAAFDFGASSSSSSPSSSPSSC